MIFKSDVQIPFLKVYLYIIIEQLLKIHLGPHEESMTWHSSILSIFAIKAERIQRVLSIIFLKISHFSQFSTIAVKSDYVFFLLNSQGTTK